MDDDRPRPAAGPALSPAAGGTLSLFPEELRRKILEFADIPSLLCLGDTNTAFREYIYTNSPWLWKDIDFAEVSPTKSRQLSDRSLEAFLTAVNAREVTESLSLMGCTAIQGSGLEPLRRSQCLEQVDLRRTREEATTVGETGLDDGTVIDVLSTMAPLSGVDHGTTGLKIVKFRKQQEGNEEGNHFYECFSPIIEDFYCSLHDSLADQVERNRVSCASCSVPLIDRLVPKVYFDYLAHIGYCAQCKTHTCGEGDCRHAGGICGVCMDQKCVDCGDVFMCILCGGDYCMECKESFVCPSCNYTFCSDCEVEVSCGLCDQHKSCTECIIDGELMLCEGCDVFCCRDCRLVEFCQGCERTICSECALLGKDLGGHRAECFEVEGVEETDA